jgi:hypothetical protein
MIALGWRFVAFPGQVFHVTRIRGHISRVEVLLSGQRVI